MAPIFQFFKKFTLLIEIYVLWLNLVSSSTVLSSWKLVKKKSEFFSDSTRSHSFIFRIFSVSNFQLHCSPGFPSNYLAVRLPITLSDIFKISSAGKVECGDMSFQFSGRERVWVLQVTCTS